MLQYEIQVQVQENGKWSRFLHWWGMRRGYAEGAFRMLVGFSTGKRYRLIASDDTVIDEQQAPSTPTT